MIDETDIIRSCVRVDITSGFPLASKAMQTATDKIIEVAPDRRFKTENYIYLSFQTTYGTDVMIAKRSIIVQYGII